MFGNASRVGCGGGTPRIAHSQSGTSNRRGSPPEPPRYARYICPPWPHRSTQCLRTLAEWDAAADCLALRIRTTAISVIHRGIFRVWTLPLSHTGHQWCVATSAERDAAADCLVLRICVYRLSNWRLRVAAAKIPTLGIITHQADTWLVPGDLSGAWQFGALDSQGLGPIFFGNAPSGIICLSIFSINK